MYINLTEADRIGSNCSLSGFLFPSVTFSVFFSMRFFPRTRNNRGPIQGVLPYKERKKKGRETERKYQEEETRK